MTKYSREYMRYYPVVIGAAIAFILMASYLITRNQKPREEFQHITGDVVYLSSVNPYRPQSEPREKHVYLIIKPHEIIFDLFTGTDKGDFSPRVNQLYELDIGDSVEIYYEENNRLQGQPVNKLLQYMDKDGELIYLRSNADRYIGYFTLGSSLLLLMVGYYMKTQVHKGL